MPARHAKGQLTPLPMTAHEREAGSMSIRLRLGKHNAVFDRSAGQDPTIVLDGRTCDGAERGLEVAVPQEAQQCGEEDRKDGGFPQHHRGRGPMHLTS